MHYSCEKLASELTAEGFTVSADTVARLLVADGYSLQSTRKTMEGGDHPDRDAQFQHIAAQTKAFQADDQPVISVDCKKKELVGEFKNGGREWQPEGHPVPVNVYDFIDDALFKAIPYGVYDVTRNEGWVSVGIDHDTAEFAVSTIRQWWRRMGQARYPEADRLYVTADGGGSNGSRNRLWKRELQRLADDTGLAIHVSHLPPGTSKWNKIEHRLFSQITLNWRGRPLSTLEAVVKLIGRTTTQTGLKVKAIADQKTYRTGIKISDEEMARLNLEKDPFHGNWNYVLKPHTEDKKVLDLFCGGSRAAARSGCSSVSRLRPPPGRRSFPLPSSVKRSGSSKSRSPAAMVLRDKPVARATTAMPPRPKACASAAAHKRRVTSLKAGARARNLARTMASCSSFTAVGVRYPSPRRNAQTVLRCLLSARPQKSSTQGSVSRPPCD